MDILALRDITYGMYIISTKYENRNVGCFVNTATQITSENPIISISVNKQNCTNKAIKETKKFALSILSEETRPQVIGKFGFYTSKDVNKFENMQYEEKNDLPIIKENICGYMICELLETIDVETHDIFIARVVDAKKENDYIPMTYKYYHEKIKGTAPKTAPTYISPNS